MSEEITTVEEITRLEFLRHIEKGKYDILKEIDKLEKLILDYISMYRQLEHIKKMEEIDYQRYSGNLQYFYDKKGLIYYQPKEEETKIHTEGIYL